MKILEISRSFYPSVGGLEKFVADRLRIYESLGIKYQVLSTDFSNEKVDYSKKLDNVTYLHRYTPYDITLGLKTYLASDYDVLSVNQIGRYFSDFAIFFAFKKKKKIVLTPHFHFHTHKYAFVKKMHTKYILKKLLTMIDKMICFTEYEKKYWTLTYGVDSKKIVVIPHYLEMNNNQTAEYLTNFGKYILYLGRYEKNKKIDLLIEAFASLKVDDWKLVLTIELSNLSSMSKKLVEEDSRIILLGNIGETYKNDLLKNCEALILPSNYEAFGTVLLEASQWYKPILASNLRIFREVLNTKFPIFFENNLVSLRERLKYFFTLSVSERAKLGEGNFMNLKRFSFNEVKRLYGDLFESILNDY